MKKINLIKALLNIISNPATHLDESPENNQPKINNMGKDFEEYIKNIFAGTIGEKDDEIRIKKFSELFSYQGNQNNPPDLILKNAEAIEIKKVQTIGSIALNSSYPKSKLSSKSKMITKDCKNCENNGIWEKNLIYSIGVVDKNKEIKNIFFIYGNLYTADEEIYLNIKKKIKIGIEEIENVSFTETNELGKVKKVDPLGITDLRIRGMWSIEHPLKVFDYISEIKNYDNQQKMIVFALIPKNEYEKFNNDDIEVLRSNSNVFISDKKIKNPNNASLLIDAIFIKICLN